MQYRAEGRVRLFGAYGGYGPGMQVRDFVSVDDVVAINLWFLQHGGVKGIFNVGSGRAQPFNDVAHAVVNGWRERARRGCAAARRTGRQGHASNTSISRRHWWASTSVSRRPISARCAPPAATMRLPTWASGVRRYVQWLAEQPAA